MSYAVGFALLSMTCGGFIDTLYKVYARKTRSRGMYLFGMGLVWLLLQLAALGIGGEAIVLNQVNLEYGLAAGAMVTLSNLLYIESMTHLDISLGATIYRLNTVGVVIFSVLFLGESLGGIKLLGIACGIIAVIFLYRRAGFGVISKAGITAGASPSMIMVLAAASWVAGGLFYAVCRERHIPLGGSEIGYCVASGLVVFGVANFLILGLRHGEATVVIPIANLSFIVALGMSVLLRYERISALKVVAVGFASAAIVLLSRVG